MPNQIVYGRSCDNYVADSLTINLQKLQLLIYHFEHHKLFDIELCQIIAYLSYCRMLPGMSFMIAFLVQLVMTKSL